MTTQFFLNISRLHGKDAPEYGRNLWRLTGRAGDEFITERHPTKESCHARALEILNAYKYLENK